jgi:hypothetical protein
VSIKSGSVRQVDCPDALAMQEEQVSIPSSLSKQKLILSPNAVAQAVYLAVFSKDLVKGIARLVPPAATAAGLSEKDLPDLMKVVASPLLAKNYSPAIAEAVFSAYQEATRHSIQ